MPDFLVFEPDNEIPEFCFICREKEIKQEFTDILRAELSPEVLIQFTLVSPLKKYIPNTKITYFRTTPDQNSALGGFGFPFPSPSRLTVVDKKSPTKIVLIGNIVITY